jgi:hypothetical protein
MNKARITLTAITFVALLGGAFAFKAARFTGVPSWTTTISVSTLVNGRTYATIAAGMCTTTSFFITSNPALPIITTLRTTPSLPPTTVLGTATDGSGFTTAITTFPCTTTLTRVTTLN